MTIKQRLYPTRDEEPILKQHCGHTRFIYNLANEQRLILHQANKYTSFAGQCRELTEIRSEHDWLKKGSQQIQASALRDNDQAWQNRFNNPKHYGQPGWRTKGKNEGFLVTRPQVKKLNAEWGAVWVPKADWVKFRITQPFEEIQAAKSARFKLKPNGEWSVSFILLPDEFERELTGAVVGIDVGVEHTLTLSTGEHFEIPSSLSDGEQKRFDALSRLLPTQWGPANKKYREAYAQDPENTYPSKRYLKTKQQLAELHDKAKRRAVDWIEKITTWLVENYDVIGIEDLKIENMTKKAKPKEDPDDPGQYLANGAAAKRGLNKSILSQRWGMFRQRLEEKAECSTPGQESQIIAVDPKNTSLQCRECHWTESANRENQAVFACKFCTHTANADVNAAGNIEDRALAKLDGVEVQSLMLKRLLAALSKDPVDLNQGYAEGQAVNGQSGSDPAMPSLDEDKELTIVPNPQPESPSFR